MVILFNNYYSFFFAVFSLPSSWQLYFLLDLGNTVGPWGYLGRKVSTGPWCTGVSQCFFFFLPVQEKLADTMISLFSVCSFVFWENKWKMQTLSRDNGLHLPVYITIPWCTSGLLFDQYSKLIFQVWLFITFPDGFPFIY